MARQTLSRSAQNARIPVATLDPARSAVFFRGLCVQYAVAGSGRHAGHDSSCARGCSCGSGPGDSRGLTMVLPPGDYQLICPIPGHEQQGMSGLLTVVGN